MRSQKTKDFYKKLAKKYKVSEKTIAEIDNAQFKLLAEIMKSSDSKLAKFFVYRIPYFGMFYVSNRTIKTLKEKYKLEDGITNIE